MKKYVYDNATVYITIPDEQQIDNIRKSTEQFAKILVRKGLIRDESRRNSRRVSSDNHNARGRTRKTKG